MKVEFIVTFELIFSPEFLYAVELIFVSITHNCDKLVSNKICFTRSLVYDGECGNEILMYV